MKAADTLYRGLPIYREILDKKDLQALSKEFLTWVKKGGTSTDDDFELVYFLKYKISSLLERREASTVAYHDFNNHLALRQDPSKQRELVLQFARFLGTRKSSRIQDQLGFNKFFGPEAVIDRYNNQVALIDRTLCLVLDRLGFAVAAALTRESVTEQRMSQAWEQLRLEEDLLSLVGFGGDPRVQQSLFNCLSNSIRSLSAPQRETALSDSTLRYVYRSALEPSLSAWIQCEALDLLGVMSTVSFITASRLHLERQGEGEQMFARARIAPLLEAHISDPDVRYELIELMTRDKNAFVRQAAANGVRLLSHGHEDLLARLVADEEPSVIVSALEAMPALVDTCSNDALAALLNTCLEDEQNLLISRLALEIVTEIHQSLRSSDASRAALWQARMLETCRDLHSSANETRVRRWASRCAEFLWLQAAPEREELYKLFTAHISQIKSGGRKRFPISLLGALSISDLGRILSLLAINDHGFDVEFTGRHFHVGRGHRFATSLWRVMYELFNSATDKREGFRHTIGRHFYGTLIAPSSILCEQAKTKVPGEPLYIDDEDGWRPFLPLVDNLLSSLNRGYPIDQVQIVTTEGITQILPPTNLLQRITARWGLNRWFSVYADKRNWQPRDPNPASQYAEDLQKLGFRLKFTPHEWQSGDERVQRFFPATTAAVSPIMLAPALIEKANDYFYSLYQNTLTHLSVFLAGISVLFFGSHLLANQRIYRARRSIAMSIGGWGTRGKSGTERLKAALINALGYTMVSKTTGCEAMFIFARPFGKPREMFLFRPYDKATIWEQANLLSIARGLDTEVFLWECMALTPSFVEILQRQWMRDDFATITNAYPDHEDIQGPAGVNIPQVISNFIPRRSTVVTTEEFMLPILRSEAEAVGSELHEVGWRDAIRLSPDVLSRFPYDEHPYNIALVMRLAALLGIDQDFAVKEMADRVIADLGVLKTFPISNIYDRQLQFVNGMSANERFGCLGNWRRMGFDSQNSVEEPKVWLVTVVNNRADRVARSKVFASILVNDLAADAHVLIGTNLSGLVSYIDEAWQESFGDFSLGDEGSEPTRRLKVTESWFDKFRIPFRTAHFEELTSIISEQGHPDAPAWIEQLDQQRKGAEPLLAKAADPATQQPQFEVELARFLRTCFDQKLKILEDSASTGEQVIDHLAHAVPPNMFGKVIGMQNIKGTGLDFMYRWLAWETVARACDDIESTDLRRAEEGRQNLMAFREFGLLAKTRVIETLSRIKDIPANQAEALQAQLAVIETQLMEQTANIEETLNPTDSSDSRTKDNRFINYLESILDSYDAIARRRRADLIYRELVGERVSPETAALELQALNKRQKGGWLHKRLSR